MRTCGWLLRALLSDLHFGRFGWFMEALWTSLGLVPAVLAFTGVFICCRRVIYKKPSNPKSQADESAREVHVVDSVQKWFR